MRTHLVNLLFRLLDPDTREQLPHSSNAKLRAELDKLYNNAIIMSWLKRREDNIFQQLKKGASHEIYLGFRGNLLEIVNIRNRIEFEHKQEEKRRNKEALAKSKLEKS